MGFQDTCAHERIVLVESGYEHEWEWRENTDGTFSAIEDYPASFSDDGDGEMILRCKTCLKDMGEPGPDDEWDHC